MDNLIIGCGLTGSVIARTLADQGQKVEIWERRDHIGGNMYDYIDEHGFLVQKYGPHIFHTMKKEIYDFICKYEKWQKYDLICGAVWAGKYTPTPFNFTTIDTFYPVDKAALLKEKLKAAFPGREFATVIEVLEHFDPDIQEYAKFLFQNDYAPYTAKQWGVTPAEIDPSVLQRVPLRFSYREGYFDDFYQVMPVHSYTVFFKNLLNHPNIQVKQNIEALNYLTIKNNHIVVDRSVFEGKVFYSGTLDELFGCVYGKLPYRSLRFEWRYEEKESLQPAPVVAYPQEEGYTRITEYKKLPIQNKLGTSYAVEYPLLYRNEEAMEPYYPVLTENSQKQYESYRALADTVQGLVCCGRLGDFKYYNMDQALEQAITVCQSCI